MCCPPAVVLELVGYVDVDGDRVAISQREEIIERDLWNPPRPPPVQVTDGVLQRSIAVRNRIVGRLATGCLCAQDPKAGVLEGIVNQRRRKSEPLELQPRAALGVRGLEPFEDLAPHTTSVPQSRDRPFLSHDAAGDAMEVMSNHHDTPRARTEHLMDRMARRDVTALAEFMDEHKPVLASVMRSHLAQMGWTHPGPDEIHDLVMDAVLELWRIAPSWRPDGGAAPWVWATARLRRIAAAYLGQHASDISQIEVAETAEPFACEGQDADGVGVLASLAARHHLAELLAGALAATATQRDQGVFLDVAQEIALGNPRPAVTVGARWGMTASAVRKVVERIRRRISALVDDDSRYGPVAAIPAVRKAAA